MAGDHFPNKYFPKRYFPGRYFQGAADAAPGSISASLTATATLTGSLQNGANGNMSASLTASASLTGRIEDGAPVVSTPTRTTGGGPSNLFYLAKYRGELRRTIKRAMRSLDKTKRTNGKKKKVRNVRKAMSVLLREPDLSIVEARPMPPDYQQFEIMKVQISSLMLTLKAKERQEMKHAEELKALLEQYELAVKKIEREEEEQALIVVMALLAA
jgi:hypothetical protein